MENGYIRIRVMASGRYADCWQRIFDGAVVAHVNDAGDTIALPEVYESVVLTGQVHFAPGVLVDPTLKPTPSLFGPADGEGIDFKVIAPFGPGVGPKPEPKAKE